MKAVTYASLSNIHSLNQGERAIVTTAPKNPVAITQRLIAFMVPATLFSSPLPLA
jgi:hypothetical protein